MVMWENSRCSALFHFGVPGGKWQTVTSSPVSTASAARSAFQARVRQPLEPPAPAVMNSRRACGYSACPAAFHQRRTDSTANAAVSRSVPAFAVRRFEARDY
jgi:hypothetical protein